MATAGTLVIAQRVDHVTFYASHFPRTTRFYSDPNNPAAQWVREHPTDPRAVVIGDRIAAQPQATWLTDPDPNQTQQQVQSIVAPAEASGAIPVLVAYAIPDRDCGGRSAGGATSLRAYENWINGFAQGMSGSNAIVILEPDALAHISCLTARQRAARYAALNYAAQRFHLVAPRSRVYYDAGNAQWEPAHVMVKRLRAAGINNYGSGIALNVSNFDTTDNEVKYGGDVLGKLGNPRLRMVIDTSRNGAGPAPHHAYCDPRHRKLGAPPVADPGVNRVDAFLWVKEPGQSDGCIAPSGTFVPNYAYGLAGSGHLTMASHH